MAQQKDNLTDVVEILDKNRNLKPERSVGEGQVIDNDGEIITLGQNDKERQGASNKGKVIEPYAGAIEAINNAMVRVLERLIAKFSKKDNPE